MSNRQQRSHRKAQNRRHRVMSTVFNISGFDVHLELFDFERSLSVMVQRNNDGHRFGMCTIPGRRWRHMDQALRRCVDRLMNCFDTTTAKDC